MDLLYYIFVFGSCYPQYLNDFCKLFGGGGGGGVRFEGGGGLIQLI